MGNFEAPLICITMVVVLAILLNHRVKLTRDGMEIFSRKGGDDDEEQSP